MHHLWMQRGHLEKSSTRKRHFTTEKQRRAKCAFDKNFLGIIDHESVSIPTRWRFITVTLNSCNAFINPLLYAVRVPEFRKALALSCVRKRAKMNPENIRTRGNHAAVLSQETYLKAYESESNTHALKFHKNFVETKL